jgi:hypothetical protein
MEAETQAEEDQEAHQQQVAEEEIESMIKSLLLLFLGNALIFSLFAQNETDLYRFSRTSYNGSARFEAMGGSFGALGADLSSSQINPAGYGRYSSSTAGISFFGGAVQNKSDFNQSNTTSGNGIGGISNFAVVITEDASGQGKGIQYKQWGFGMNRIENFRSKVSYTGEQYASLLDEFTGQAYGYDPFYLKSYFPFSTFMAYETWAINYDPASMSYYSLLNEGDVKHTRSIETQGGQTELFLSYSANFINKLYYGVNLGLRHHKYEEEIFHNETLTDTSGTSLRGFDYSYRLNTSGWGANLKIGAIYLVSEALRLGLAVHTPTFTELRDQWSSNMSTHFADSTSALHPTLVPEGDYKYKIRNPYRLIGSLAYIFGTRGCINIDVEALDYRMAKFRSTRDPSYTPYAYEAENEYAKEVFKPTVNIRVGGEIVLMSTLYIRGGVAYYGKAFKEEMQAENSGDLMLSCGLGVKTKKYQMDIAYRNRMGSRNYYAFSQSMATINTMSNQVVVSMSLLF